MNVSLRISAGNSVRLVEMPGVTTMHYAAYRVADEVGIVEEYKSFYLTASRELQIPIPSQDLAINWGDFLLYLICNDE